MPRDLASGGHASGGSPELAREIDHRRTRRTRECLVARVSRLACAADHGAAAKRTSIVDRPACGDAVEFFGCAVETFCSCRFVPAVHKAHLQAFLRQPLARRFLSLGLPVSRVRIRREHSPAYKAVCRRITHTGLLSSAQRTAPEYLLRSRRADAGSARIRPRFRGGGGQGATTGVETSAPRTIEQRNRPSHGLRIRVSENLGCCKRRNTEG